MALARKNRLYASRKTLSVLRKEGKAASTTLLSAFYVRNIPKQESRFCVSISSNVAKRAIVRNRIQRTIYIVLQEQLPTLKGIDMVIYAKKTIAKAQKEQIRKETADLLGRVKSQQP